MAEPQKNSEVLGPKQRPAETRAAAPNPEISDRRLSDLTESIRNQIAKTPDDKKEELTRTLNAILESNLSSEEKLGKLEKVFAEVLTIAKDPLARRSLAAYSQNAFKRERAGDQLPIPDAESKDNKTPYQADLTTPITVDGLDKQGHVDYLMLELAEHGLPKYNEGTDIGSAEGCKKYKITRRNGGRHRAFYIEWIPTNPVMDPYQGHWHRIGYGDRRYEHFGFQPNDRIEEVPKAEQDDLAQEKAKEKPVQEGQLDYHQQVATELTEEALTDETAGAELAADLQTELSVERDLMGEFTPANTMTGADLVRSHLQRLRLQTNPVAETRDQQKAGLEMLDAKVARQRNLPETRTEFHVIDDLFERISNFFNQQEAPTPESKKEVLATIDILEEAIPTPVETVATEEAPGEETTEETLSLDELLLTEDTPETISFKELTTPLEVDVIYSETHRQLEKIRKQIMAIEI